ncbi:MAG: winged helix-turn-helix transcriptional regulator [Verrucomicrobiota bacterium]|nr:winged helix-turn-helix transcriptional regulator [Verrucomicrobiota bacterium]
MTWSSGSHKTLHKTLHKIIKLIEENSHITTSEMATKLNISRRAVAKHISQLKEEKKLKRVGPDKGGHWEIIKQ